jgi:glutathione synthase/RimK-type ligase-like ATP-grasp enzyme
MSLTVTDCCVLNGGNAAWAFESLASQLGILIGVDVSARPRRFNYLLQMDGESLPSGCASFVPPEAIQLAADKRLLAEVFNRNQVSTPLTKLIHDFPTTLDFVRSHADRQWCLKYPTSCGANGHRILSGNDTEPPNWPQPFVLQEFIQLQEPEVFRTYGAGGEIFGWVARRFPKGTKTSPWVAHARGARYVNLNDPPDAAAQVARDALKSTGLLDSFGCVDLLQTSDGSWVALEVGTDGLVNHVDRDIGDPDFEQGLNKRIAAAFWSAANQIAPTN